MDTPLARSSIKFQAGLATLNHDRAFGAQGKSRFGYPIDGLEFGAPKIVRNLGDEVASMIAMVMDMGIVGLDLWPNRKRVAAIAA